MRFLFIKFFMLLKYFLCSSVFHTNEDDDTAGDGTAKTKYNKSRS